eukprot:Platyproteum_vivax@DN4543_c0_g1_i1.p1
MGKPECDLDALLEDTLEELEAVNIPETKAAESSLPGTSVTQEGSSTDSALTSLASEMKLVSEVVEKEKEKERLEKNDVGMGDWGKDLEEMFSGDQTKMMAGISEMFSKLHQHPEMMGGLEDMMTTLSGMGDAEENFGIIANLLQKWLDEHPDVDSEQRNIHKKQLGLYQQLKEMYATATPSSVDNDLKAAEDGCVENTTSKDPSSTEKELQSQLALLEELENLGVLPEKVLGALTPQQATIVASAKLAAQLGSDLDLSGLPGDEVPDDDVKGFLDFLQQMGMEGAGNMDASAMSDPTFFNSLYQAAAPNMTPNLEDPNAEEACKIQ